MDVTSLIKVVKDNIVQFQPTIQGVVGAVITTLFLRKNTCIAEFEKIKIGKYDEVLESLLQSGKMTYFELYKCRNFLNIANLADKEQQKKRTNETTDKTFDFDWFMRFYDASSNISNEEVQKLWAKILSGEVENSGSFSLRTIETLKNMNQHEATLLQKIAHLVLTEPDGTKFILDTAIDLSQNINEKYGIEKTDFMTLEECGILNSLSSGNPINLNSNPCGMWSDNILLLLELKNNDISLINYKYNAYNLTKTAIQLLSVVDSRPKDDYLLDVGKELSRKYSGTFIIKAYRVINSDVLQFEYDSSKALII